VECNQPIVRDYMIQQLGESVPGGLVVVDLSTEQPDPLEQVAATLRAAPSAAPSAPVMLVNVERYLREPELAQRVVRELNLKRSYWARLGRVVVIWAPEHACAWLMRGAPDFFDWRSGYWRLTAPGVEGYTSMQAQVWEGGADGSMDEASRRGRIAELESRLALQQDTQDRAILAIRSRYQSELARHLLILGDLDGAEKLFRESLEINRKLGRLEGQAIQLGKLGLIARTRGDLDGAEKLLRESLEINRKLGRLEGQASNLGNLGSIAQTRGDLDGAEKLHRESLEIHRKLGRLEGQAYQLANLGLIALTRGDLDGAEKLLRESLEIDRKLGRLEGQANQLGNLGVIARTRGDLDGAEKLLRESLEIDRKLGRLYGQASSLGNLGLIAMTRGGLHSAEKLLSEALEIFIKLGILEGQAIQLGNLGSIAEQRGHIAEVRQLWTQSRDLYSRIGMPQMVKQLQGWLDGLPPG
jgi:tetratricopeptide (TPR) repeat protein